MKRKILTSIVAIASCAVFAFTGCTSTITSNHFATREDAVETHNQEIHMELTTDEKLTEDHSSVNDPHSGNAVTLPKEEVFDNTSMYPEEDVIDGKIHLEEEPYGDKNDTEYVDVFSFAIYEIVYNLSAIGYDVYRGSVVYGGEALAFGLIYTSYEYDDVGNLTCGFLELVAKDSVPVITDEMAEGGLICFADSQSFNSGFVVDRFITLHASSGIWNGYYFVNRQITNYAVQISIQTASVAEMDRQIDCINYDEGRTMWLAEVVPTMSFEASSLYTADETKAYNAAVEALQQITAIQNSNAYKSASYSLVIIETSLLESIALSEQKGTIGTEEFGYYDLEAINGIELEDNQIVMVTASSGVQILTIPTEEELKAAADSRAAMGLIQIIGNALLAVGGVAICIVTWGTATPLVAGICIAAGTVSTTYALSNIAEGISNVYYGLNGDITSSAVNPVKDLLADAIGDEQTANIVYHAVGISSSIIQSLILPFNAGLNFANGIGATAGQTVLIVGRVVGTEIVKMAVTAGVSYLASIGLSKLTVDITGSEAVGQLVGFAGALLAGFVTYKGLTAIDMKYNFSGLYAKVGLGKVYSNVNLREEALKHFNPAEWGKMSMTEKKTAIERLAHVVADELGLNNPPKIKYYYKKADSYGYYSDTNNSLNINTYYFTNGQTPWVEIVDTVAHEMRHAYQYARLLSGINDDITYSYKHYISSDVDPVGYFNQACEVDAYNYGSYWAKLLKEVIL